MSFIRPHCARSTALLPNRQQRLTFERGLCLLLRFLIDAFARRIVGWRASRTANAGFVLDALEQAIHQRRAAQG
ncbi:hypothetical protein [Roseibium algae]|uniref:hypothetical protein n=1 Tax=Roseibium algae TaxID=3123038 RepID=UPI003BF5B6C7